ncbi:MAG: hypothetical protein JF612_13985 [Planctomycetia bacterium]|nr:hypothetical protein [Planctomycetia bacterium]
MPPGTEADDFRAPARRPPPDYSQRSVKLRIFIYLAAIMAVLSVIERSRNPQTWQWMWGRGLASEAPLDTRLRESGHRTANDPAGAFVAMPESKAEQEPADITAARAAIQDDTPVFRPAERKIWFHELAHVLNADEEQLENDALKNVAYLQLHKQPADYRGKVVSVKGTVRLAYRTPAPANDLGVNEYYRGKVVSVKGTVRLAYRTPAPANDLGVNEYCVYVLQPVGQPDAVIFIYALAAPPGFPRLGADSGDPKGKMRQDVEVTGVFFKRCAYAARGGTYTAPILIAKAPRWRPPPVAMQPSDRFTALEIAGAAVAALLLAICIAAVMWKRTGRSHRLAAQQKSGGFVELGPLEVAPSPQEVLRELERQARGDGNG